MGGGRWEVGGGRWEVGGRECVGRGRLLNIYNIFKSNLAQRIWCAHQILSRVRKVFMAFFFSLIF